MTTEHNNQQFSRCWYAKTVPETLEELYASEHGLTSTEALKRLEKYGHNRLPEAKEPGTLVLFLRQFESPLIYILLISSIIVFLLGEPIDAYIILFVLVVNAFIGTLQEGRARNTLSALKNFTKTQATVLRDNVEVVVSDEDLVPGDILILREGDKISADARVFSVHAFKVDESALTGESNSVSKHSEPIAGDNVLTADQRNMVFKGTFVVSGSAKAVIAETALNTVIGSISKKLVVVETDIPLRKNIADLSRLISIAVLAVSIGVFFIGLLYGRSPAEMFFTSVAIAVSLIPEGLPVVITLVLATGMYRMSRQNALVKKLQAVEALGRAKVIAVDKTGTITKNELMVTEVYVTGRHFEVTGDGYEAAGDIKENGTAVMASNHVELLLSGKIATYCADAAVSFLEKEKTWKVSGDPTEAALLVFGEKTGFKKDELENEEPLVFEIPFDSRHKYHATVHSIGKRMMLTVVGAPEIVLASSNAFWNGTSAEFMTDAKRAEFEEKVNEMSSRGLRVVGFAVNENSPVEIQVENMPALTMVGLYGMRDVIRDGVRESILEAQNNGISVIMITGDHRITAQSIAEAAGIYRPGDRVVAGVELDRMSVEDVARLRNTTVFARVTPEHKLKIIESYRKRGEIVAMTGDGVNDALSLIAADLGIAMGRIGTEVTKASADIVLLDDNFKSIISAIEEGRSIYKSIRNVLLYLFSTGVGELFVIVGGLLLALPIPLLPSQILWLNLVTDGLLVLALALEPKEKLSRKPFRTSALFIDRLMLERIVTMGLVMTLGTLYLFSTAYEADIVKGWTMSLTVLAVFQWFNAFNCRSHEKSVFSGFFSNRYLVYAFLVTAAMHFFALYDPLMQRILRTMPLSLREWGQVLAVASSVIVVEELRKAYHRHARHRVR